MIHNSFFRISFLLFITVSNAIHAQTSVGVRAGMHFSNVLMKDESGNKNSTKPISGFHIGLTTDISIAEKFYFQPAILYATKGFRQTDSWFTGAGNELKVTASYFEMPLNLIYKPQAGNGRMLIGAGPYIGYGTGGKWKADKDAAIGDMVVGNSGKTIFNNDAMTGGALGDYVYGKPWDFGANFLLGYEFRNKFSLQLDAQLGINNLQRKIYGADWQNSLRNRGWGISAGYKF
jgi:hypothetical protein